MKRKCGLFHLCTPLSVICTHFLPPSLHLTSLFRPLILQSFFILWFIRICITIKYSSCIHTLSARIFLVLKSQSKIHKVHVVKFLFFLIYIKPTQNAYLPLGQSKEMYLERIWPWGPPSKSFGIEVPRNSLRCL